MENKMNIFFIIAVTLLASVGAISVCVMLVFIGAFMHALAIVIMIVAGIWVAGSLLQDELASKA